MTENIARQYMCEDLLVGAVEGGTGYWAEVIRYDPGEGKASATIKVIDEGTVHFIDWTTIDKGLKRASDQLHPPKVNRASLIQLRVMDASEGEGIYDHVDWDAETADIALQLALFGELVYG